jgi:spore coat protein CotF
MELNTMNKLTEQDIFNDSLTSEKNIASVYNTYASECADKKLRDTLLNILYDNHIIQNDVFSEMINRGWYQVTPAEQNKINQAKSKFQSIQM